MLTEERVRQIMEQSKVGPPHGTWAQSRIAELGERVLWLENENRRLQRRLRDMTEDATRCYEDWKAEVKAGQAAVAERDTLRERLAALVKKWKHRAEMSEAISEALPLARATYQTQRRRVHIECADELATALAGESTDA